MVVADEEDDTVTLILILKIRQIIVKMGRMKEHFSIIPTSQIDPILHSAQTAHHSVSLLTVGSLDLSPLMGPFLGLKPILIKLDAYSVKFVKNSDMTPSIATTV